MGIFDIFSGIFGGNINKISAAEVLEKMKENQKIQLIDVREQSEFREGHIPRAKNIPLGVVSEEMEKYVPEKEEMIYIYCHSGMRSVQACNILMKKGYTNVYNLGGITSWPYDIEQ